MCRNLWYNVNNIDFDDHNFFFVQENIVFLIVVDNQFVFFQIVQVMFVFVWIISFSSFSFFCLQTDGLYAIIFS